MHFFQGGRDPKMAAELPRWAASFRKKADRASLEFGQQCECVETRKANALLASNA